jgi:DNA-binding FrmR family transcriptional regulator
MPSGNGGGDMRAMTVDQLRQRLASMPGHLEVVVNATDNDGNEVFAAVKMVDSDPTCVDVEVCRIYADQSDEYPVT